MRIYQFFLSVFLLTFINPTSRSHQSKHCKKPTNISLMSIFLIVIFFLFGSLLTKHAIPKTPIQNLAWSIRILAIEKTHLGAWGLANQGTLVEAW